MIKKSNKKFLMSLLVIVILFLSGCSGGPINRAEVSDYHSGTQGLELSFLSQNPPSQVFEEDLFQIVLNLRNKGAYHIEGDHFAKLSFIYDSLYLKDLKINTNQIYQQIEGKGFNLPHGDDSEINLGNVKASKVYGTFETLDTTMFLRLCYPYQTNFAEEVCIDNDVDGRSLRDQPCKSKVLDFSDGQGGPVSITKITPKMVPYNNYVEPQFTITIENLGNGFVLEPKYDAEGNFEKVCANDARKNVIQVEANLDGNELECIPEKVTLKNDKAVIVCRSKDVTVSNINYYSTLEVTVDYNYEQNYNKDLKIVRKEDLAFANYEAEVRCQAWEINVDNECVNLCDYCGKNMNDDPRCVANEDDKDKTVVKSNFACVYGSYSDCTNANRPVTDKNINNNCIERENLCWPGTYCGVPTCAIENNNYPPRIETIQSESTTTIEWRVTDINDQLTREYNSLFGSMNMYPDMERTCGTKVNEDNIPISYYKFVNKDDKCLNQNFKELETVYQEQEIYPPTFKVEIGKNETDDTYEYVCIKALDKLGEEVVNKYLIESSGENTRLKYQ